MTAARREFTTRSPEATHALGRALGERIAPGMFLGLVGALGAGKTQLVKGIAAGAGVPNDVTVDSPTFVLINEYVGRMRVHHVDVYRLHSPDELSGLGLDEMLTGGGAVIVEWADRFWTMLPEDRLTVYLEHEDETTRRITVESTSDAWRGVVESLPAVF